MRLIGLDVGEKRIGVARADTNTKIAVPVGTISATEDKWTELARLARLYDTDFFVLGLPRNNAGSETAQSLYVRNFAKTLTEKIPGAKIRFEDESLTSVEAEQRLKRRKKSYQKSEIDAEAATIILQDFVENFKATIKSPPNSTIIEKKRKKAMLTSKKALTKSKKLTKWLIIPPTTILLIFGLCGSGYLFVRSSLAPIIKDCRDHACPNTTFTVAPGQTIDTITNNLKTAGLIKNPFIFKLFHRFYFSNLSFKTGTYQFNPGLSASKIIKLLNAGAKGSNVFSFTIAPGETIFDIKKKLLSIGYTASEIDTALKDSYDLPVLSEKPADTTLEGYLYGETHEFYQGASVKDIFTTFLKQFDQIVTENDFKTKFKNHGLSLHEGIILASIVQKEAYPADQSTVAQVFYSRLAKNKHLGSDVTVKYALDLLDPERKTYRDNASALTVKSCYNTSERYGHPGLPCGPISTPSLSALQAVAHPSTTNYLYFLTGDDGKMYYGHTENDHEYNRNHYCKKLCNTLL